MDFDLALRTCKKNFGVVPREFSLWDRLAYLRVPKPLWVRLPPPEDLRTLFGNLRPLFADGKVVWGFIVQANCALFEPGTENLPGEIVFSLDAEHRFHHLYLQVVGGELRSLKGTKPAGPQLLRIADYLSDELVRVFGLPVPDSISPQPRFQISTTLFVRKHLPLRQICGPILPVVVNPKKPHVVLPLPARYWPQELVKWYLEPPVPFEDALAQFSDRDAVRRLEERYHQARLSVETSKQQGDSETAARHRNQLVEIGHELQLLLERLWHEAVR